jgi:cytochrome c oxidase cbb3-type subunit III
MTCAERLVSAAGKRRAVLGLALACLAATACERENRRFREGPPTATPGAALRISDIEPGPRSQSDSIPSPYDENAWSVSQGKRFFHSFNCNGCHAEGGGSMGPPLMDDEWIYGSKPENIYATIVQGRPNGMPSFGRKIPPQQVWQLVAYVRSLSGLLRSDVASGRDDHMQRKLQEQDQPKAKVRNAQRKPAGAK